MLVLNVNQTFDLMYLLVKNNLNVIIKTCGVIKCIVLNIFI